MGDKSSQPDRKPNAKSIRVNAHSDSGHHINVPKKDPEKTFADYVPPTMEDPQLDKVIDDIIMSEGNEVLAAEDSNYSISDTNKPKKKKSKLAKVFKNKWFYIGLFAIIITLFAVPYTRYLIVGSFIKSNYQITIVDSVTNKPVSDTSVSIAKKTYSTDSSGQASFKLSLGKHKYTLSKQYYATSSGSIFVGFSKNQKSTVKLLATGRQVSISVVNKLSGRPLAGAKISILNTTATTNSLGQANIVLPTKKASYLATITANSFNTLTTPIVVSTALNANVIKMIPTGNIFYLSNATGTINVIKANLDGSNPTTLLAGTGKETSSTKLMPSPDWKYLILEAQRSGTQPELYVINTSSGNLTEFDSAPDNFTLIGWNSGQFIYDEIAPSQDTSTVGREQIKSYNATTNQLNEIDENQIAGSSPTYAYQSFSNFELLPNLVVYSTIWNPVNSYDISNNDDTIRGVEPNGLNKKDYSSYPAATTGTISVVKNLPESLYISVNNNSTNQISYFNFANGAVNPANIDASTFSQSYPLYYVSPSGTSTLWNGPQNNQSAIFTGNQNAQNGKRLLVPNGYSAYSWYDNIYVLLNKGNQLYITPITGSNNPTLIGTYYTPH